MTSYVNQMVAVLEADTTSVDPLITPLMTLLIGGVYFFGDLGRKGISREITPEIYDPVTGLLKPTCLVMPMDEHPDYQVIDAPTGFHSTETPVITWILQDGATGYATIEAAYDRMYRLLHQYRLTDGFQVLWQKATKNQRSWLAQDASDYEVIWVCHGKREYA